MSYDGPVSDYTPVIVVLGKCPSMEEPISPIYTARLEHAMREYKKIRDPGKTARIILCGGKTHYAQSEAQVGLDYLSIFFQEEFPELFRDRMIRLDETSQDTVGNAVHCKELLLGYGCFNPTIISSEWHLRRAKYVFEYVLGEMFKPLFTGSQEDILPEDGYLYLVDELRKLAIIERLFKEHDIAHGDHERIEDLLKRNNGLLIKDKL